MDVSKDQEKEAPIAPDHDLNRLAAFVDQRLTPDERRVVTAHLSECETCRALVAELARALAQVSATPAKRPAWTRPVVWLPIAASIVLVIGAGWLARDRFSSLEPEAPSEAPPSVSPSAPVVEPPRAPTAPLVTTPPPTEPADTKRGGEREIAGHRFRLEAGVWVDAAYDAFALLPVVDVRTAAERDALLSREPGLKPFMALGARATVVHNRTVYRFDLPR